MLTLYYDPNCKEYPDSSDWFSPDEAYPEYPYKQSTISRKPNKTYHMVRELLACSGYDRDHYGKKEWNPLGDGIIVPGNTVLLKPNWVENKNKNLPGELSCLVTNPAVVRAVIDYVVIALKGTGRIVVADAPMQGCDLQDLFTKVGYDKLFDFYKQNIIDITVLDLRKYSVGEKFKGVTGEIHYNQNEGSYEIDLRKRSMHAIHDSDHTEYRVEDYSKKETASYHSSEKHIYNVSATALNADVIINLPKPKTHRLAGITGAVKNFVGITYDKASLPHRREGDKETGIGDAYNKHSVWKHWMGVFNEIRTVNAKSGKYTLAKINDTLMKACYVIGSATSGDKYRIGSWYGNDTIWRTAVDLNNIVLHCDREGQYHERPIRRVLTIGDMIVSGEKEGPVGPSPKPLGVLALSDNNLLFDLLVSRIMGFSEEKLPMFNDSDAYKVFNLEGKESILKTLVRSNQPEYNATIEELQNGDLNLIHAGKDI